MSFLMNERENKLTENLTTFLANLFHPKMDEYGWKTKL